MRTASAIALCILQFTLIGSAAAQVAVVSSTVEERVAGPGEQYTGTILLRNASDEPRAVKIYATDYAFYANGETSYGAAGTMPRSNAAWIVIDPGQVVLPPNGEAAITYTVGVPGGTHTSGSYWCMVMVEPLAGGSDVHLRTGAAVQPRLGIQTKVRYGIQIVTHMPQGGNRTVQLSDAALLRDTDGRNSLRFAVTNTGEQAYRPKLKTEVYNDAGELAARFENARGLVYPGSSVRQTLSLPHLARGNYKILIIADTGDEQLYAAQYRVSF